MSSDRPDPFVDFATQRGLRISTADLPAVPRDVLAPPSDLQWYTLVTLSGASADSVPIQTLFITEASDPRPASVRDLLWWLSSDCWALEQADREYAGWAATYHYPADDPATQRLFQVHIEQASLLIATLGERAYRELLALYVAEIKPGETEIRSKTEHANQSRD